MKSVVFAFLLLAAGAARAFPPAPRYTLHGMVRDQSGQTVNVENAAVLLLRDGRELSPHPGDLFRPRGPEL